MHAVTRLISQQMSLPLLIGAVLLELAGSVLESCHVKNKQSLAPQVDGSSAGFTWRLSTLVQ